jgi:hypothetical protein
MNPGYAFRSLMTVLLVITLFSCKKKEDSTSGQQGGTVPVVFADEIASITFRTARASGYITSQGSSAIKAKGACWDTVKNPTTANHIILGTGSTGNIEVQLTSLEPGGHYYVRLFATNDAGTGYSSEKNFITTHNTGYLVASTISPDTVSYTWAGVGGSVDDTGSSAVTERGICWANDWDPSYDGNKINCGKAFGVFHAEIHGLQLYTTYYYRAYAVNAQGVVYGEMLTFTTRGYMRLYVPGTYQGWNPSDTTTVITSLLNDNKFEGYIWFPANTDYKYTQGINWNINYGDNNGDGHLEPNGGDIHVNDEGYYKLNADLVNYTHSFLRTTWAIIGSATPGGPDADTEMAWDAAGKVWTLTVTLNAGDLKFRANHSWDLYYGDNEADGVLDQNGGNIHVSSGGSYLVTLNLNHTHHIYSIVKQ